MKAGPVEGADRALLVQRCKELAASFYGLVPTHWDPLGWMGDAVELAVFRHLQITPCERAVRVGQIVEHYEAYAGDPLRYCAGCTGMSVVLSSKPAPYCSPTMRQFLRDLGAGRDPMQRFTQPHGRLAADTVAACRSRGWVKRRSISLTAAGRAYLVAWCNPESPK